MTTLGWIIRDSGWNEGSLLAAWASAGLVALGIDIRIQPLYPCSTVSVPFPGSVPVLPPLFSSESSWKRLTRRPSISSQLGSVDQLLVDQECLRLIKTVKERMMVVVRDDIQDPSDVPWAAFEGMLALNRRVARQVLQMRAVLPSRVHPVPLPISLRPTPLDSERERSSSLQVVVAGPLTAFKGLEIVINAMTVLRDRKKAARLTVVGDGPEARRLKSYAGALTPDTTFVSGAIDWEPYIARADVLVAPQMVDSLGADVMWALGLGIPIVGRDLAVFHEHAEALVPGDPPMDLSPDLTVMEVVEQLEGLPRGKKAQPRPFGDGPHRWLEALGLHTVSG